MERQKLTKEEVEAVNGIREGLAALKNELGTITLLEMDLETRKNSAIEFLGELKTKEANAVKELEEKYGVGSIDLATAEFIPAPEAPEEATEVSTEG